MFWSVFLLGGAVALVGRAVVKPVTRKIVKGTVAIRREMSAAVDEAHHELDEEAKADKGAQAPN